jgi:hypothetical protein
MAGIRRCQNRYVIIEQWHTYSLKVVINMKEGGARYGRGGSDIMDMSMRVWMMAGDVAQRI